MTAISGEHEQEIVDSLGTIRLGQPRAVLSEVTTELGLLFDCTTSSYRAIPEPCGWELEFLHVHGVELEGLAPILADYVTTALVRFGAYDPLCPEIAQRNRVCGAAEMARLAEASPSFVKRVYEPMGVHRHSHMRVLVCDGPFLLTWLGAWRSETLGLPEERTLARIATAMRERLRVDRILNHACSLEATALALEAIVAPAFWVRSSGAIEFANAAGRMLFDRDRQGVIRALKTAIETSTAKSSNGTSVFPLASAGVPVGALVVMQDAGASVRAGLSSTNDRGDTGRALEARLDEARTRWGLTPRHVSIVRLLAGGNANKDIATKLGLSPGTVEVYLTEIFRRTKVESRLQLVARLWE